jgi:cytosine deaminase
MYDWILRGCRLSGREDVNDVAIVGDKIASVAPRIEGRGGREMDVAGRLLMPGFVNAHVAIAADGGDLEGRAAMALEGAVRQGTTALRLTVDVDRAEPLMPLRVLARVRARYAGRVAAQVAVRAPFSALTRDGDVRAQLDKAARAGADALALHMDVPAPAGDDLRTSLEALAATGLPVDILVDTALPPGEVGLAALALTPLLHALPPELARRTRVVQPSALAAVSRDELAPLLARLAALGVTVVICPFDALRRGGRTDVAAARRGIPRVTELLGAGVRVALGSGRAWRDLPIALDPTALAWAAGYATYLGTPPALETLRAAVTTWAAGSLGLPAPEIREGHRADLVVLEAPSFAAGVVDHAEKHAVLVGGRLVHESSRGTERVAPAVAETGSSSLTIRGATLPRRRGTHDVVIVDGVIRSIAPSAGTAAPASDVVAGATIDAAGRLLIPSFVDAHLHVDKTFVMDRVTFPGGILAVGEAIAAMASVKAAYTEDDLVRRGRLTFERALRHGTTAIRAQCDVDPVIGLMALEALVRLRREFASLLDVQIVAFPQEGLLRDPRTVELMRRAVRAGADVIGGGPLDDDYRAHIAQGFELARELGVPVDIHADLPIDRLRPLPEWEAPLIAAHARASGLAGRVAIGHFASSSALTAEQTRVIAAGLAEAGVHLAALPASEMYRQGLSDPVNSRRGVPRVRELLDAGVNVAFASNNIRDAFVTFGDADMLEQALLGALAAHLDDWDTVLDMVTSRPAALMGLAHRNGVEIGMDADLVLLDARSAEEAIGAQVEKLYVIRRGRIVVRNERTTSGAGRA